MEAQTKQRPDPEMVLKALDWLFAKGAELRLAAQKAEAEAQTKTAG